jgi:hypothetical protein
MQLEQRADRLVSLYRDVVLPLADSYGATRAALKWSTEDRTLTVAGVHIPLSSLSHIDLVARQAAFHGPRSGRHAPP